MAEEQQTRAGTGMRAGHGGGGGWRELEPNVYVRTFEPEDVNVGLVVGSERALVVDTSDAANAPAVFAAVRQVTALPLVVVNTHAHYDHIDGNPAFAAADAQPIRFFAHANAQRLARSLEPANPGAANVPYEQVESWPVDLDLGGMSASILHLGRAHTDGDLLVSAGSTLFAGDVLEEGGNPNFEDSYPQEWLAVLGKIASLADLHERYVPGHGAPMGEDDVVTFTNTMRSGIHVSQLAMSEGTTDMTKAIPILPYGPVQSRVLLRRLRELARR